MKSSFYVNYSTRSLSRGGQRTALALFCIAVGVMAIVGLQLASGSLLGALTGNVRTLNGGDVSVEAASAPLRPSDLAVFGQLKSQGVISAYSPQVTGNGQVTTPDGKKELMTNSVVDPATYPLVGSAHVLKPSGGSFKALLGTPGAAVITQSLAKSLHLAVGGKFADHLQSGGSVPLTVTGIIANDDVVGTGDHAFASFQTYQQATDLPPAYTFVGVTTSNPSGAAGAAAALRQRFPLTTVQTTDDLLKANQDSVQSVRRFLEVVGLLALLIGGIGIVNTMQVLLSRRRTEIAMLKTTGYRRRDLYLLFGLEAALLGLLGGILGAVLGIGVSALLLKLFENATQAILPLKLDATTILGGILIGFCTALIFGLLPIVSAAAARPIAVLRELPEGSSARSRLQSLGLLLLLSVLFFVLAWAILGSPLWAAAAVYGGLVFLGLLSLGLSVVLWIVGRLPIPDHYSIGYLALVTLGMLVAIAITAVPSLRGVGVLIVIFALLGYLIVLLPRPLKISAKMALRNIGRTRARTTMTLVALFIGVFTVGLVLVLGQDLKSVLTTAFANETQYNLEASVPQANLATMNATLKQISGIEKYRSSVYAPTEPVAVNGQPIAGLLPQGTNGPSTTAQAALQLLRGVQGYSVNSGDIPEVAQITAGRNLTASDNGSTNVILPDALRTGVPNLNVGDTLDLIAQRTNQPLNVGVVGFYKLTNATFDINLNAGPIFSAQTLPTSIAGANPSHIFFLRVPPAKVNQVESQIGQALPGVFIFNFGDIAGLINRFLNNFVIAFTAIGALALIAGVVIVANAVALAMLERRRELGMLKALGYTSERVLGGVLLENGFTAALGGLLGMVLVALAVFAFGKLVKTNLGVGAPLAILIVAGVAVLSVVTALLVAWNSVRLRPLEVLRYE